jgi:osmotically-inducible protein OsmY
VPASTIRANIETALKRHFDAERQHITVRVADAVVTLSGTVTSWYERHLARKSAWNSPGVHRVDDDLLVGT